MAFSMQLLLSLFLCTAGAVKVAVLIDQPCTKSGFSKLGCAGATKLQAKFPNDDVQAHAKTSVDCTAWATPGNVSAHKIVMMVGFNYEGCSQQAAAAAPNTWIVGIDFCPDGVDSKYPNFVCAIFAESQPAYVAGYLAGLVSKTKVMGVIGGVPVPPVQRLFNGFTLGVKASCPDCHIQGAYVNSFFNPANANGVATHLVNDMNADVVYGCGGGTGSVAISKAAELGAYAVGVDVDEFETTFAGAAANVQSRVLTSVLKKIDVSVTIAGQLLKDATVGQPVKGLTGNTLILDYKNGAVGTADCHLACSMVGLENQDTILRIESQLSANVLQVPIGGFGWSVPLAPSSAAKNTFHETPMIAKPPAARVQSAVSTFNAWLVDFVVVFGGRDLSNTYNDLWLYNIQAGMWLNGVHGMNKGTPPPALAKSCAVSFDLTTYIFGGRTAAGSQSDVVYAYTYQPTFLGFADAMSPNIIHTWSNRTSAGSVPLPVEGPGCAKLNASCAIAFGGRETLAEVSTVRRFCVDGTHAHWSEISATGTGPAAREMMGVTIVADASKIKGDWPAGQALIVAGGLSGGFWLSDVWLLPLDSSSEWKRLPDLPRSHSSAPVVSEVDAPGGGSKVLVVQPTSAPMDSFTFDPDKEVWNTQKTHFASGAGNANQTEQAIMVKSSGGVGISPQTWAFGGTIRGAYQNKLFISSFAVETSCLAGERSKGVGCEPCGRGYFSVGGVGVSCQACAPGKYSGANISSTCEDCPAGHYGNHSGMSACPVCAAGTYKKKGSLPCDHCPAGSFSGVQGAKSAGECKQCKAGKYTQGLTGMSKEAMCVDCPAGRALAVPFGKATCEPCGAGMFSAPGAETCTRCPVGKFTSSEGSTECIGCGGHLIKGSTLFQGATKSDDCTCMEGTYRVDSAGKSECVNCGEGLLCDEAGLTKPKQAPGYYIHDNKVDQVYACMPAEACQGAPWGESVCRQPRSGFMCMDCPDGQVLNEDFEKKQEGCQECAWLTTVFVALAPLVAFFCCLYIMYYTHDSPLSESPLTMELQNSIGQLIMFFQVSNAIFASRLQYGDAMENFMNTLIVHLDPDAVFSNTPCLAPGLAGPVVKYGAVIAAPVMFMFALGVVYTISKVVGQTCKRAFSLHSLLNIWGEVLVEFYVSITLAIFAPFQCFKHPNGELSVLSHPEVICGEGKWNSMLALAIFGILAYPLNAMAIAGFMTWKHPKALLQNDLSLLVKGRFLFDRWTPSCYWFCNVSLIRNFLIAVLPCVMPQDQLDSTVLLMTLTLVWALVMLLWFRPRRTPQQQALDTFVSVVQLTVLSFGVASSHGTPLRESLSTACVVFISSVVLIIVGIIALRAYQLLLNTISYSVYLSHHSGQGGTSTRVLQWILKKTVQGQVFYDIDHAGQLPVLIDAVRLSNNLLVVFGSETFCRPWCLASLVCAYRRGTPIHRVIFVNPLAEETVVASSTDGSEKYARTFTGKQADKARSPAFEIDTFCLRGYGLSQDDVYPAIQALTSVQPILLNFLKRDKTNREMEELLSGMVNIYSSVAPATDELFSSCNLSQKYANGDAKADAVNFGLIMIDHLDGEAISVSRLFASVFSRTGTWLEDQDLPASAFATVAKNKPSNAVFIFSVNSHKSPSQLARMALLKKSQPDTYMVPIAVGVYFDFPDEEYFRRIELGTALDLGSNPTQLLSTLAGGEVHLRDVSNGLSHVMSHLISFVNVPALPLSSLDKVLNDIITRANDSGRRIVSKAKDAAVADDLSGTNAGSPRGGAGGGGGFGGGGGGNGTNASVAAVEESAVNCEGAREDSFTEV